MACKKRGFMKGKGEVLLICDGTGFGYGCYCLVGWYRGRVKKGEGSLQGCDSFGREGRGKDDIGC